MLDTVEKVWTEAGLRDNLHTERFTIARTDKGGEGGTVTCQISDKSIKLDGATTTRRCDNADGRWREARHPDAVWVPGGHLPVLCIAAGIGLRARSQVRNRAPRGRSNPDVHLRGIRRLHHQRLGTPYRDHRHQAVRTPHRGRHRGIGPRTANWTPSEPVSRSLGASGMPSTCARPSSCSTIQLQRALAVGGRIDVRAEFGCGAAVGSRVWPGKGSLRVHDSDVHSGRSGLGSRMPPSRSSYGARVASIRARITRSHHSPIHCPRNQNPQAPRSLSK